MENNVLMELKKIWIDVGRIADSLETMVKIMESQSQIIKDANARSGDPGKMLNNIVNSLPPELQTFFSSKKGGN